MKILLTPLVFMLVFAQNLPMLLMGNMLCGFPWGMFDRLYNLTEPTR